MKHNIHIIVIELFLSINLTCQVFGAETADSLNQGGEAAEFKYQIIQKPESSLPLSSWDCENADALGVEGSIEVQAKKIRVAAAEDKNLHLILGRTNIENRLKLAKKGEFYDPTPWHKDTKDEIQVFACNSEMENSDVPFLLMDFYNEDSLAKLPDHAFSRISFDLGVLKDFDAKMESGLAIMEHYRRILKPGGILTMPVWGIGYSMGFENKKEGTICCEEFTSQFLVTDLMLQLHMSMLKKAFSGKLDLTKCPYFSQAKSQNLKHLQQIFPEMKLVKITAKEMLPSYYKKREVNELYIYTKEG